MNPGSYVSLSYDPRADPCRVSNTLWHAAIRNKFNLFLYIKQVLKSNTSSAFLWLTLFVCLFVCLFVGIEVLRWWLWGLLTSGVWRWRNVAPPPIFRADMCTKNATSTTTISTQVIDKGTPCSRVLRDKLTVAQLVEKSRFVLNPDVHHRVHKTPSDQSAPLHSGSWRSILNDRVRLAITL
jgi:hypothetical protein